jgi:hypothetical protein
MSQVSIKSSPAASDIRQESCSSTVPPIQHDHSASVLAFLAFPFAENSDRPHRSYDLFCASRVPTHALYPIQPCRYMILAGLANLTLFFLCQWPSRLHLDAAEVWWASHKTRRPAGTKRAELTRTSWMMLLAGASPALRFVAGLYALAPAPCMAGSTEH